MGKNVIPQTPPDDDPILSYLYAVKDKLDEFTADRSEQNSANLTKTVTDCVSTFKSNPIYQNDPRFLKVYLIYMDCVGDFKKVYGEIEEYKICLDNALLYETCALYLEVKGELVDAHRLYCTGISRNARPIERLKEAHDMFYQRLTDAVKYVGTNKKLKVSYIDPWEASTADALLQKILPHLVKYDGYHSSKKNYPGNIPASASNNSFRNKIMKIGLREYQIKGYAGQGGFAQVFKACTGNNSEEIVALKIQKPPFPWEFYLYRLLDKRIPQEERSSFGFAQRMHHYSDCSVLVCDYLSHGTLQDAINTYVVVTTLMEEVSCIYYTIEMLRILETLHSADIIHGDFKPDNLLIRSSRVPLTTDASDLAQRRGPWHDQGLCLVDWGRGIDLKLFPSGVEFVGDCRTSGFRCVEMQEEKPWKYQVDTYGLCANVHLMLHGSYMEIEKKASSDGSYIYLPKLPFKRYWKIELWENLFKRLLNVQPSDDHLSTLRELKESFLKYFMSTPSLVSQLKQSLTKQKSSMCSS